MDDFEIWLTRVYDAEGDRKTLDTLYDEWARDYDQQIWASGNPYVAIATGMAARHVRDFDARILDVGCGTGYMGQVLHQMGYENLEGLDPSAGMLRIAKRKGIYQAVHQLALGPQVDLEDERFDAVVALGVLTVGHAPPDSLDGILKLLKPGGVVIFSLAKLAYDAHGFKEHMSALDAIGVWRQLDRSRLFRTYPFWEAEAHIFHWVYVYQKVG